jgi:8-oxo-dGTP diphosphatase
MSEGLFKFCPLCSTSLEYRQIGAKERAFCPSCGWVNFPDPKVAAAVLVIQDGKVLLTRRIFEPHKGFWSLPGGFVDAYEDPILAAERECLEETGLKINVNGLLDVFSGREHPRGADIILIYKGSVMGGNLQFGDDADAVGFFPLVALPPLAFETTKKILRRFTEETSGAIV